MRTDHDGPPTNHAAAAPTATISTTASAATIATTASAATIATTATTASAADRPAAMSAETAMRLDHKHRSALRAARRGIHHRPACTRDEYLALAAAVPVDGDSLATKLVR